MNVITLLSYIEMPSYQQQFYVKKCKMFWVFFVVAVRYLFSCYWLWRQVSRAAARHAIKRKDSIAVIKLGFFFLRGATLKFLSDGVSYVFKFSCTSNYYPSQFWTSVIRICVERIYGFLKCHLHSWSSFSIHEAIESNFTSPSPPWEEPGSRNVLQEWNVLLITW